MSDPLRNAHDALVKQANDQGRLLEVGFLALKATALRTWSPEAIETARLIYMAGAQHLWSAMFSVMAPDREPTMQDIRRMGLISGEIEAFTPKLNALAAGDKGTVQ